MSDITIRTLKETTVDGNRFERWGVYAPGGETDMAAATIGTVQSRFNGSLLPTLTIGGVQTAPPCRRQGHVRRIFDEAFRQAPQRGWAVSFLHPFSFSYYRKFGYEHIADKKSVRLPIARLEDIERCHRLVLLKSEAQVADALAVFEAFCAGRNILFRRGGGQYYSQTPVEDNRYTYLWHDENGAAAAYLTVSEDHAAKALLVRELAYTGPEALRKALGFVRMWEGEFETVHFQDISMMPEFDYQLRHYTHARYAGYPSLMGRVLNTEALLKAGSYPTQPGRFVLRVQDDQPLVNGTYAVEYGGGDVQVTAAESATPNLTATAPALVQLLYGYGHYNSAFAGYLPGVQVQGAADDFFRAFPWRPTGLFEHF